MFRPCRLVKLVMDLRQQKQQEATSVSERDMDQYGGFLKWGTPKTIGFNTKMIEGSLEVKLPTIWTVEKQR